MNEEQLRRAIESALHRFAQDSLFDNALYLFATLGYHSTRRLRLAPNNAAEFCANFDPEGRLRQDQARLAEWEAVEFLFQLTGDELRERLALFDGAAVVDRTRIESYLFFAIRLRGDAYTRTQLSEITRAVNRLFPMPVLLLFQYGAHGEMLTLAVIDRRQHSRDAGRDVLARVTLVKDIHTVRPHRAHLDVLCDLALGRLAAAYAPANWAELHRAWQAALDSAALNRRFYQEIANWYFWAIKHVTFPAGAGEDEATRNAVSVIRLITRLIFVWFIKEKGLVPETLFNRNQLAGVLHFAQPGDTVYYKAILQNLFFATLNTEMGEGRKFAGALRRHPLSQRRSL
jgi:adenine-specific DNA-methyltransferase